MTSAPAAILMIGLRGSHPAYCGKTGPAGAAAGENMVWGANAERTLAVRNERTGQAPG